MCNMYYELLSNMFFLTGVNYKKTHMSKLQKTRRTNKGNSIEPLSTRHLILYIVLFVTIRSLLICFMTYFF